MFQLTMSGKIQAVTDRGANVENASAIEIDFVQKIFVSGKLTDRNWRIYAPKHKLAWLMKQHEKGFTVVLILSDVYGMASHANMRDGQVHATGQLLELQTL